MKLKNMPTEMCRIKVSELQRRLAVKATDKREHRFNNLYDLLTWEPLMSYCFDRLMTNAGSRTAGIDGMDKTMAKRNKKEIIANLRIDLKKGSYKHQPVRRVYIPKNNGKKRPLGIPTLTDRLVQMMVKTILEPIFESDFHQVSHGFRPKRSCHTAMAHLHTATAPEKKKMFWTIEGDISGYFDHIGHKILIRLLKRRIRDKKLLGIIWQMLHAGIMEGALFARTTEGTTQGGVASPLLANVYLHELDEWFHKNYTGGLGRNEKVRRRYHKMGNAFYVRYADDFVVAWNGPRKEAERLKEKIATFLKEYLRLELSEEKTHITHVTKGYDFLGFTIRRYYNKSRGRSDLIIRPSKKNVMSLKAKIKALTKQDTVGANPKDKIVAINCLLRGWANYYRHQASSRTFGYVSHYAFKRMETWLRKKTGRRKRAIYRHYYQKHDGCSTWVSEDTALFNPGQYIRIERIRYRYQPNPYLNPRNEIKLSYHLKPLPAR
ncbi:MAG: group II intron reverse transcriptase/maturase [Firmicutes bacterium]|nr:group II intron reverse transcriptase/maturase [Bacillota bacterium]